jgi:endonuclease
LGQLLYYMGWIDRHLGQGPCRGIVIASEISEELAIAVSRAPGVALYRYKMNFSLEPARAITV